MATQIRLRRDPKATVDAFVGAEAEPIVDTDNERLSIHNGNDAGGMPHVTYKDAINNHFQAGDGVFNADVYAVTLPYAATAYTANMEVLITPDTNNVGACDVNISGLGDRNILKVDGDGLLVELEESDFRSGIPVKLIYDGIRFIAQLAPAATPAAFVLIETQVITASVTSVDFVNGFDNDLYSHVIFKGSKLAFSNVLRMNISLDGGATYLTGVGYTRSTNTGTTGIINRVDLTAGNAGNRPHFEMTLNTSATNVSGGLFRSSTGFNGAYLSGAWGTGFIGIVNAIRFSTSFGNFTEGEISMYGVLK